jgi:hypothetical protein
MGHPARRALTIEFPPPAGTLTRQAMARSPQEPIRPPPGVSVRQTSRLRLQTRGSLAAGAAELVSIRGKCGVLAMVLCRRQLGSGAINGEGSESCRATAKTGPPIASPVGVTEMPSSAERVIPRSPSGVFMVLGETRAVALNRPPHRDAADPDGGFSDDPEGLLSAPPLNSALHSPPLLIGEAVRLLRLDARLTRPLAATSAHFRKST